jgi:Ser/Thr protein kinase RdoA (MazF antagonist)
VKPFATLSSRGQIARLARMADLALPAFGVRAARLDPLGHAENTTYRVEATDGRRYVLQIQRPGKNTVVQTRSEMQWLAALRRDTDLGVPEPVPAQDGDLLVQAEMPGVPEPRICVLFRWMDGRFVNKGLRATHLERVGAFTGRLQEHSLQWTPPPGFTRWRVDGITRTPGGRDEPFSDAVITYIEALIASLFTAEDAALVGTAIRRVRATLATLDGGPNGFGLIHGDLHQGNYLFHHGAVRAIDFDDCGYSYFLYDLGTTLAEIYRRADYPALRAALLRGYGRLRPLPPAPERVLHTFVILRCLQVLLWLVESRDHPAFSDWAKWTVYDLGVLRDLLAQEPPV